MPAQAKPLPEDVEQDPQSKKVRCLICKETDPTHVGTWILKTSLHKHLTSMEHKHNITLVSERKLRKQEETIRHAAAYANTTWRLPGANLNVTPAAVRPDFFAAGDAAQDTSGDFASLDIPPPCIPVFTGPLYDPAMERERLRREVELMMMEAEESDELGMDYDDDSMTDNITGELHSLGLNKEADMEEVEDYFSGVTVDHDFTPYPNKLIMLLDILDNLPRLRMSGVLLQMVLWLLRECGVRDVPSFSSFRKMQGSLQKVCRNEPTGHTSSLGNRFHVIDVRDSVARAVANPEIAKHLHIYPEETNGPIAEVRQCTRWREFKPSELTPMYARGVKHFYVNEIAQLDNGQYVIPLMWIVREGVLQSDAIVVTHSESSNRMFIITDEVLNVHASSYTCNYFDICLPGSEPLSISAPQGIEIPEMPNVLRKIAEDEELIVIFIPIWGDDVSGNRSKQYNKHINMYMAIQNLPGALLQQEYFVQFVSTSPHATSPEQFAVIRDQIKATHTKPIRCYNAHTHHPCRVILRCPDLPADNPQQSEEASHMGGNANCKCRRCKVGGPAAFIESDHGYHALYQIGEPRSVEDTRAQVEAQIETALYGVEKPITDMQTATGTKDKVAQHWIDLLLVKAREMKAESPSRAADSIADELCNWLDEQPGDKINPLLTLDGLDPNRDTPVEILHTVLLGIVKYEWHVLHTSWTSAQQDLFVIRLQSTNLDGLSVPPIRVAYMMQYRNGLIGKHFKTLMQTMIFHVHGLVSPSLFALIKAIGELGAVLWVHEIDNMDSYLHDLEILIDNVLDAFGAVDGGKIIDKSKLHVLKHLIEDIRRYGPAIRNSTEVFECFNAIFRLCSILSNHLAPSRDIARKFTALDYMKHILSGGYWLEDGSWTRAGVSVRNVLHNHPIIQRHLGWAPQARLQPGLVKKVALARAAPCVWASTHTSKHSSPAHFGIDDTKTWITGTKVHAMSGDICSLGSWVVCKVENEVVIGIIIELLCPEIGSPFHGLVTIEQFGLGEMLHSDFGMPVLTLPSEGKKFMTVRSSMIQFLINVQHDCRGADCTPAALRRQLQEREETNRFIHAIDHKDDGHFVLNTHALHNAVLLRRILPRSLTTPHHLYSNPCARHYQPATEVRASRSDKRAVSKAKAKATREANKLKKIAREKELSMANIPESEDSGVSDSDGEE